MRYENHDLDGQGAHRTQVHDMPPAQNDFWAAVTDVPCPSACGGLVRWAEAGHVPGYRICDTCGRHYLARGSMSKPTLLRVRTRRSKPGEQL